MCVAHAASSSVFTASISTCEKSSGSPRAIQLVGTPALYERRCTCPAVRKSQTTVSTPPVADTDSTISTLPDAV